MTELAQSLQRFQPEIALTVGLLLVVLVDASGVKLRDALCRILTVASLGVALLLCVPLYEAGWSGELFGGMLALDPSRSSSR